MRFVFIGEGTSDGYLVDHIQNLLVGMGVNEVAGEAPNLRQFPEYKGGSVEEKLRVAAARFPSADLFLVHRDADNVGRERRLEEIEMAAATGGYGGKVVPVVPVRALEAWLLADVGAIKNVAGNPSLAGDLGIPRAVAIERMADPKKKLEEALVAASGLSGRKLEKFKGRFGNMRYRLTTFLVVGGPVDRLPSYNAFREVLEAAVAPWRGREAP